MAKKATSDSLNSFIQPIKTIAEEVFLEKVKELKKELKKEIENCLFWQTMITPQKIIENPLNRCGDEWTQKEDALLEKEVKFAVEKIATNHGRTEKAIKIRISRKKFFDPYNFLD